MYRRIFQALVAVVLLGTLAACGSTGSDSTVNTDGAVILDVRTPEEFASGHLAGSVNIDVSAGDFEQRIATLDPAAKYLIYCRSGNRSAQALARMQGLGFSSLVDLGGVEAASSATGVEVVR
jgi:phage shock protein E